MALGQKDVGVTASWRNGVAPKFVGIKWLNVEKIFLPKMKVVATF
jgi:hypothetical protein